MEIAGLSQAEAASEQIGRALDAFYEQSPNNPAVNAIGELRQGFVSEIDQRLIKFIEIETIAHRARNWADVIWAISTRVDPKRDSVLVESTPIDYLDFASPVAGLGSKLGIDATTKWPGEVDRRWGTPITMRPEVVAKVDKLWSELGLE